MKNLLSLAFIALMAAGTAVAADCPEGKITAPCYCGNSDYWAGYCCNISNDPTWFDPFYSACPSGPEVRYLYVSALSTCPGSGTLSNPWCRISQATSVADTGDVILVKTGTYSEPGKGAKVFDNPAIQPLKSGTKTNPIIIRAYPGANVTIVNDGQGPIMGSLNRNYIIFDGFHIVEGTAWSGDNMGVVTSFGQPGSRNVGIEFKNMIVDGKFVQIGDNHDAIRLEETSDSAVRNSIIRGTSGTGWNNSCIKLYWTNNITVENNEIYNCYTGIFDKEDGVDNTYRKNIIRDQNPDVGSAIGPAILMHTQNGNPHIRTKIYQNIFHNYDAIYFQAGGGTEKMIDTQIFNNVFYDMNIINVGENKQVGIAPEEATNFQMWNNIFRDIDYPYHYTTNNGSADPAYSDYNSYDSDAMLVLYDKVVRIFDQWKDKGYDLNGINSDPLFADEAAFDFHLKDASPARGAGIDRQDNDGDGISDETIPMGAYIYDDEVIGVIDFTGTEPKRLVPEPDDYSDPSDPDGEAKVGGGCNIVHDNSKSGPAFLIALLLLVGSMKALIRANPGDGGKLI